MRSKNFWKFSPCPFIPQLQIAWFWIIIIHQYHTLQIQKNIKALPLFSVPYIFVKTNGNPPKIVCLPVIDKSARSFSLRIFVRQTRRDFESSSNHRTTQLPPAGITTAKGDAVCHYLQTASMGNKCCPRRRRTPGSRISSSGFPDSPLAPSAPGWRIESAPEDCWSPEDGARAAGRGGSTRVHERFNERKMPMTAADGGTKRHCTKQVWNAFIFGDLLRWLPKVKALIAITILLFCLRWIAQYSI